MSCRYPNDNTRVLMLYGINSYFWDQWKRHPWEAGGGVNLYPEKPGWRLNLQVDYIYKCAAGGTFGLYTAGRQDNADYWRRYSTLNNIFLKT